LAVKNRDTQEREYLNELPTSFSLPAEAVDRLRAAAATIINESPAFQRMLQEIGAKVMATPSRAGADSVAPAER
jgi:NTE family protein